jgi:hypothetical protein
MNNPVVGDVVSINGRTGVVHKIRTTGIGSGSLGPVYIVRLDRLNDWNLEQYEKGFRMDIEFPFVGPRPCYGDILASKNHPVLFP